MKTQKEIKDLINTQKEENKKLISKEIEQQCNIVHAIAKSRMSKYGCRYGSNDSKQYKRKMAKIVHQVRLEIDRDNKKTGLL